MVRAFIRYIINHEIVLAISIVAIGWLIFEIKDIIISLFISYIIATSLSPYVVILRKYYVPKSIAVFITYFLSLLLVVLLIFPLVPFFSSQLQALFISFPSYLNSAANILNISIDSSQISSFIASEFESIGRNAISLTGRVFTGLFSTLTILVVSFYLLMDKDNLKIYVASLFGKHKGKISSIIEQSDEKLGAWLRGQFLLSIFIGFITWIALTFLNFPFALPLAVLAGILEIIPTLGPILASIPAIIVALSISPQITFAIILLYIAIQLAENNILVPKIMEKAVGLNPIIIILGVTAGAKLMGVLGALLSIPFISMLTIIYNTLNRED